MRRGPLLVVSILSAAVLLLGLSLLLRTPPGPPPIVLITIDTLRADRVGVYGGGDLTPRIDELAARGMVFTSAWTTVPLTVPAHASLLTGLNPPAHGLRTNFPRGPLPPGSRRPYHTVAETLRGEGCRTAAFTSASVLRKDRTGLDAGFDVYDEMPPPPPGALHDSERRGEDTVAAALEWVRAGEGPFFLWVHLFDPHAPYDAPAAFARAGRGAPAAARYDDEVRYADHCVGLLLDGLADAGYEDAVIALTSDHGEGLGEHGESTHGYLLHEATLAVPLILSAPGRLGTGIRKDNEVSITAVAPTLLSLARLPAERTMARDLLERKGARRPFLYAESHYGHESFGWAQLVALRRGGSKLLDVGAQTWAFDLEADPGESNPRVLDPSAAEGSDDARDNELIHRTLESVAARAPLAALEPPTSDVGTIPYVSPAKGAGSERLSRAENAALPNPYERIGIVSGLDRARTLLGQGRVAEALAEYATLAARDPQNPQIPFWRGRALLLPPLPDPAAAFRAFRKASELGDRRPANLAMAVTAALRSDDPELFEEAGTLLETARGRGLRVDTDLLVMVAGLAVARQRWDEAEEAIERLRRAPSTPNSELALPQLEKVLRYRRDR